MKIRKILLPWFPLFFSSTLFAQSDLPQLFLFLGGSKASSYAHILKNNCVNGVQIIYSWKQLEPEKGVYDFSKIENDLKFLDNAHKKLFIQIQDRSFTPDVFNVPDYMGSCGRTTKSVNSEITPYHFKL